MAGLKGFVVSMTLIGLFVYCMISFGINLAIDEGASQSITDDSTIHNLTIGLNSSLGSYAPEVESSHDAFSQTESTVESGEDPIQISVGSVWKGFTTIPYNMFKLVFGMIFKVFFGGSTTSVVFSVITGLVVAVITMVVWYWIRSGNPGGVG